MVTEGYPRCPRCSMPLPNVRGRSATVAGGTAIEPEASSGYLWIGLGLLALIVALVVYTTLDKDGAKTSERGEPTESRTTPTQQPIADVQKPVVGISASEEPPTALENREQAVAGLERALSADRLWSTLSVEDDTLKLVSGACADTAMQPTIKKHAASLSSVGLTMIHCVERHGALVFEQTL